MSSEFDRSLEELRAWVQREGCERVEVLVRQDGRVTFTMLNGSLFVTKEIQADLEPGGALYTPNQALHAMADGWCGR